MTLKEFLLDNPDVKIEVSSYQADDQWDLDISDKIIFTSPKNHALLLKIFDRVEVIRNSKLYKSLK